MRQDSGRQDWSLGTVVLGGGSYCRSGSRGGVAHDCLPGDARDP